MNKKSNGYDLVIPIYNEINIIKLLNYLFSATKNISKIYLCYDFKEDKSLELINNSIYKDSKKIILVKNFFNGPCEAVKTGIKYTTAPVVIVYPADDFNNGKILDKMYELYFLGYHVVCPSRFIKGGIIKDCPTIKYLIVKLVSFSLYYFSNLKIKDPTNGFRMFSRKVLESVQINSKLGFAYSLELLVKSHKKNFLIKEIPSIWIEREDRKSSFKIFRWSLAYLKWYFYAIFK